MTPPTDLAITLGLLVFAMLVGTALKRRTTRISSEKPGTSADPLDPADFGIDGFGISGTVVQFSTEYCTRCPGVRRVLAELVREREPLAFIHIDLTEKPALARKHRILQTPTILLISGDGRLRTRLSGQLPKAALGNALDTLKGIPRWHPILRSQHRNTRPLISIRAALGSAPPSPH